MDTREDKLFSLVSTGAAILAGLAVRSVLKAGYRKMTGREPPENPAAPEVEWGEALLWGALAGAAVGLSRVAARRGVSAGWARLADSRSDEPQRQLLH